MKKTVIPLVIIILLTLIVSSVLYRVVYKPSANKGESSQPRTDSQQTVTPAKSMTKLDQTTKLTAVVPVISNEFATHNPSEPSEVYWSVLAKQLSQLEESRQATAKALMKKVKPPAEVLESD